MCFNYFAVTKWYQHSQYKESFFWVYKQTYLKLIFVVTTNHLFLRKPTTTTSVSFQCLNTTSHQARRVGVIEKRTTSSFTWHHRHTHRRKKKFYYNDPIFSSSHIASTLNNRLFMRTHICVYACGLNLTQHSGAIHIIFFPVNTSLINAWRELMNFKWSPHRDRISQEFDSYFF